MICHYSLFCTINLFFPLRVCFFFPPQLNSYQCLLNSSPKQLSLAGGGGALTQQPCWIDFFFKFMNINFKWVLVLLSCSPNFSSSICSPVSKVTLLKSLQFLQINTSFPKFILSWWLASYFTDKVEGTEGNFHMLPPPHVPVYLDLSIYFAFSSLNCRWAVYALI